MIHFKFVISFPSEGCSNFQKAFFSVNVILSSMENYKSDPRMLDHTPECISIYYIF
jgi:hypothetical protein